ncbi:hypothetical protein STEG23_000447 [Scotinomys teguina]
MQEPVKSTGRRRLHYDNHLEQLILGVVSEYTGTNKASLLLVKSFERQTWLQLRTTDENHDSQKVVMDMQDKKIVYVLEEFT